MTGPTRRRRRIVALGTALLLLISAEAVARALLPASDAAPVRLLRVVGIAQEGAAQGGAAREGAAQEGAAREGAAQEGAALEGAAQGERAPVALPTSRGLDRLLVTGRDGLPRLRPDLDLSGDALPGGGARPWRVHTDGAGRRRVPGAEVDPGLPRVVVAGSTAGFGWGVDDEETLAAQLQAALRGRARVEALAVPGDTLAQVETRLRGTGPVAHLALVVGRDEALPVLVDDPTLARWRAGGLAGLEAQLRWSRLLQRAAPAVAEGARRLGPALVRVGLTRPRLDEAAARAALDRLAAAAPVSLVAACLDAAGRQRVAALAGARVAVVDYAAIHGETVDGCHPTAAGYAALAAALARQVGRR